MCVRACMRQACVCVFYMCGVMGVAGRGSNEREGNLFRTFVLIMFVSGTRLGKNQGLRLMDKLLIRWELNIFLWPPAGFLLHMHQYNISSDTSNLFVHQAFSYISSH
ncbi:hypothetical protein ILYODFUR_018638 [Ilyodon furcidens]|uniref:Secreted protein n=1 Tax=Ilyodon furcidens TaxID=33524 RepID=A0ABV0TJY5_9TELE